jgi:hypothetical protein
MTRLRYFVHGKVLVIPGSRPFRTGGMMPSADGWWSVAAGSSRKCTEIIANRSTNLLRLAVSDD